VVRAGRNLRAELGLDAAGMEAKIKAWLA